MPEPNPAVPVKHVVLGLNGSSSDPLVVRVGCQLVREQRAVLTAVHVVEVDWSHDLADDISSGNEAAAAVLDRAEGVAERFGAQLETSLLQARDVSAAVVDEAAELGADLIVVGLPYRKRFGGEFAIGRTVPYILQNARCNVLVVREPMPAVDAPATAAAETLGPGRPG